LGAQVLKNRSTDDVERFLSLIRFEHREKLEEMGLDLGKIAILGSNLLKW